MSINKTVLVGLIAGLACNWAGAMEYEGGNSSKAESPEQGEKQEIKNNLLGFYLLNTTREIVQLTQEKTFKNPGNDEWITESEECGLPLKPFTTGFIQLREQETTVNREVTPEIRKKIFGNWEKWDTFDFPLSKYPLKMLYGAEDYYGDFSLCMQAIKEFPSLAHLCISLIKNLNTDENLETLQNLLLPKSISVQKEKQNEK